MIGALMLDIAGTELTQEDIALLQAPQVGGMILFGRNIESPAQVRALTDHMRRIRPDILIAVDQEGGRVQRLKQGFSLLPAMGKFGELFLSEPEKALSLAEQSGWLMATEVLAVGIDFSFAPVLDLNDISDVIGDRGFAKNIQDIVPLASAFLKGMKAAGMASTGTLYSPDELLDYVDDISTVFDQDRLRIGITFRTATGYAAYTETVVS